MGESSMGKRKRSNRVASEVRTDIEKQLLGLASDSQKADYSNLTPSQKTLVLREFVTQNTVDPAWAKATLDLLSASAETE
jgi:hypothetical protein